MGRAEWIRDEVIREAKEICTDAGQVSVSFIQRKMRIGYCSAGKLVEALIEEGFCAREYMPGGNGRLIILDKKEGA